LGVDSAGLPTCPTSSHDQNARVLELEAALQRATNEKDQARKMCASIQKQFDIEKRNNRTARYASNPDKHHDEDDEELPMFFGKDETGHDESDSTPPAFGRRNATFGPAFDTSPCARRNATCGPTSIKTPRPSVSTTTTPSYAHSASNSSTSFRLPSVKISDADIDTYHNALQNKRMSIQMPIRPAKSRSTSLRSTVKVKKRKCSSQEERVELEEELQELEYEQKFVLDTTTSTPRKRARLSVSNPDVEDFLRFKFKAVTGYTKDSNGDLSLDGYDSDSISDDLEDLWEQIAEIKDVWEELKGEDWLWEFQKPGYNIKAVTCVTQKLKGKKTTWREDGKGLYACQDCVAANRPCFTFDGELREYLLLPLHEEDRRLEREEGFEIRYWLNL
jgi:hypothetical protein